MGEVFFGQFRVDNELRKKHQSVLHQNRHVCYENMSPGEQGSHLRIHLGINRKQMLLDVLICEGSYLVRFPVNIPEARSAWDFLVNNGAEILVDWPAPARV